MNVNFNPKLILSGGIFWVIVVVLVAGALWFNAMGVGFVHAGVGGVYCASCDHHPNGSFVGLYWRDGT